jgi:hypothetical protein
MPGPKLVDSDRKDKAWFRGKKIQAWVRTHFSAVISAILLILVILREGTAILGKNQRSFLLTDSLIAVTAIGTFLAALWEIRWNKRKISRQESEFVNGCLAALDGLDQLLGAEDEDERKDHDRIREFTQQVANISSIAFSACFKTDSAVMLRKPGSRSLYLEAFSSAADFQPDLEIPLPHADWDSLQPDDTGPAGLSYDKGRVVYVPDKKSKKAFALKRRNVGPVIEYVYQDPVQCWVKADKEQHENFSAVLCTPILGHRKTVEKQKRTEKQKFGVLNLSTCARDPFDPRHFVMAECFAKILGIAERWEARRKKSGR